MTTSSNVIQLNLFNDLSNDTNIEIVKKDTCTDEYFQFIENTTHDIMRNIDNLLNKTFNSIACNTKRKMYNYNASLYSSNPFKLISSNYEIVARHDNKYNYHIVNNIVISINGNVSENIVNKAINRVKIHNTIYKIHRNNNMLQYVLCDDIINNIRLHNVTKT